MTRIVTWLIVVCGITLAQDKTAGELAEKLVNGFVNWNELNSAGAKAELREFSRGKKEGALAVIYDVVVTGVPRDQSYALFYWPVDVEEPQPVAPKVWIAADGSVCAVRDECSGSAVRLNFKSAKGEPHRVMLISEDGKYHVVGMVIPDPITAADQGCSVEVIRLSAKFEVALVRGKGFKPNEKLKFTSNSAGELVHNVADVHDDGTFRLILLPFVKGKDSGKDEVSFKGSNCFPVVSYQWGTTQE